MNRLIATARFAAGHPASLLPRRSIAVPEPVIRPGDAPCRFLADILDFTIAEARRRSANCGLTRSHGVLDEMLADAGFAVESSIDITAHMMPMASAFSVIGKFPFWVE